MLPHPDSVIALALIRHQELQAEAFRERRAMAAVASRPAQPGVLRTTRTRLGVVLIRLGTCLQAETREPTAAREAFPAGAA
jgi:hypothetical protein